MHNTLFINGQNEWIAEIYQKGAPARYGKRRWLSNGWSIFNDQKKEVVQTKQSTIVEPVGDAGYAALV